MKKIFSLVLVISLLLPISNVFAEIAITPIGNRLSMTNDLKVGDVLTIEWSAPNTFNSGRVHFYASDNKTKLFDSGNANKVKEITTSEVIVPIGYTDTIYIGGTPGWPDGSVILYGLKLNGKTIFDGRQVFEPIEESIDPVRNLTATPSSDSVELNWFNPGGNAYVLVFFDGVIIKKDGVEVARLSKGTNNHRINGLTTDTKYTFEVIARYSDGNLAEGEKVTVQTLKEKLEIKNLTARATHERVDLNWVLPSSEKFQHVNIYRDKKEKTALLNRVLGVQTVYAAENKIFETNGTYFNDLTVDPSTTYEYTLTTTNSNAEESLGISKEVTTLAMPKPSIGGGEFEEDEITGDFIFRWTSPTTGQVKIMVGGTLYKTVTASDLSITIPGKDMKFTIFGAPDVKLIPISEDGTEGTPTAPPSSGGIGGGDIPFSPNDLLKAGNGLLILVGPIVLLALAFLLVPKLRNTIVNIFNRRKVTEKTTERRFN